MNKYDEFDDPKGKDFLGSVGPKAAFFIVLIALSFMIGVVWKLYVGGGNSVSSENVPIVRAESEPYKVAPDDAGGMDMPNKDSTIFSSLNSDPDRGIENLLADNNEESPLPRSQLFAGLNTERNPNLHAEAQNTPLDQPLSEGEERIVNQVKEAEKVVTNLIEGGADAIVSVDESSPVIKEVVDVPKKVEPLIMEALEKTPEVVTLKPVEKIEPKPAVKAPAPTPKTIMVSGDYYVQLASVRDRARADGEWNKLKSKYAAALSGYSYRVETANLAKGTFYRIQAGPVSKSQATSTCNAIKRKDPNGCLVKKK